MPVYRRTDNNLYKVKNVKFLPKKHLALTFEEETVRSRAAALDDEELEWAVDELTKRGRIRGAVIV